MISWSRISSMLKRFYKTNWKTIASLSSSMNKQISPKMLCYRICKFCKWWWNLRKIFSTTKCCIKQVKDKTYLVFIFVSDNRSSTLQELHDICVDGAPRKFTFILKWQYINFFPDSGWCQNFWIQTEKKVWMILQKWLLNKNRSLKIILKQYENLERKLLHLLHTEIRWLNRETVLNRVYELKRNYRRLSRYGEATFCKVLWGWRMAAEISLLNRHFSSHYLVEQVFIRYKPRRWKTCTLKIMRDWWKKLKNTHINRNLPHAYR